MTAGFGQASHNFNAAPLAPVNPTEQQNDKRVSTRTKVIAGISATLAAAGIGYGIARSSESAPSHVTESKPSVEAPVVPGANPESQAVSPEFTARQQAVDNAMEYLNADNDGNRTRFEQALDNVSAMRGANYFNGRGENMTATVNMNANDAQDWVLLQTFKAWDAARTGDTVRANAIANAVAEGNELNKIKIGFTDTGAPNVSGSFVTDAVPVFEVVDHGYIDVPKTDYTPSGKVSIDQAGTKLFAYTTMNPNNNEFVQHVLRFTPSSDGQNGAWSEVVTEQANSITATDIHQN